jgi:hypothetical protein
MNFNEIAVTSFSVLASVGIGSGIVLGLSRWLGKVWANRILEQDRDRYSRELESLKAQFEGTNRNRQAQLDKRIHVSRVQFETEFQALREVWKCISEVRSRMSSVRPFGSIAGRDDDPIKNFHDDASRFSTALASLVSAADSLSPFYSQEIFQGVDQAIRVAKEEDVQIRVYEPFKNDWYERGVENFELFCSNCEMVSSLIRKRIASLELGEQ